MPYVSAHEHVHQIGIDLQLNPFMQANEWACCIGRHTMLRPEEHAMLCSIIRCTHAALACWYTIYGREDAQSNVTKNGWLVNTHVVSVCTGDVHVAI